MSEIKHIEIHIDNKYINILRNPTQYEALIYIYRWLCIEDLHNEINLDFFFHWIAYVAARKNIETSISSDDIISVFDCPMINFKVNESGDTLQVMIESL